MNIKSKNNLHSICTCVLLFSLLSALFFSSLSSYVLLAQGDVSDGTVVLEQSFSGLTELPEGWTVIYGDWSVLDGKLQQSSQLYPDVIMPALLTFDDVGYLENFRFEATIQMDEESVQYWSYMGLGFDIHYSDALTEMEPLTYAGFYYETTQPTGVYFAYFEDSYEIDYPYLYPGMNLFGSALKGLMNGDLVHVMIEVYGEYGDIYFDDVLVLEHGKIPRYEDGVFGLIMGFGGVGSYYDIKIVELSYRPCSIITEELLCGVVGLQYLQRIATEGDKITSWSIADGALPDGLTLDVDGVLFGVPSVAGVFSFTVAVEGAKEDHDSKELSITVVDVYPYAFWGGSGLDFSSGDIELISADKFFVTPKTFEAWVKIPVGVNKVGVIAGNGATDGFGLCILNFGVNADGQPWLYWKDGAGNEVNYTAYANVALGEWVHVAIVYDSENSKVFCYVNGDKADEAFFSGKDVFAYSSF